MKISIITPAFNEEKLIGESLRHVKSAAGAFLLRGWQTELIVCDNNSTDRTAELARMAGAKVVFEPVNQIARARNTGAAAASGDWLLFVDADSFPTLELFAAVARQIEGGRCLAGGCPVRYDRPSRVTAWIVNGWNRLSRAKKWMAGAFIFCETRAFWHVGGFNEELFASEEIDLSQRLKKFANDTGREVVILRDAWLLTSARKIKLYSFWEHVRFLARMCVRPRQTLRSQMACQYWYDGRR